MYTFTAPGDLMAEGAVLRRNNANQFYDPDEIGVITFESLKGTMQAKFEIKGETYFSGSRTQELHLGRACVGFLYRTISDYRT
jgi:hypothetical protein